MSIKVVALAVLLHSFQADASMSWLSAAEQAAKNKLQKEIDADLAAITALEDEIKQSQRNVASKAEHSSLEEKQNSTGATHDFLYSNWGLNSPDVKHVGTTLMVSVTEGDEEQIIERLKDLIQAQGEKAHPAEYPFAGGIWLVFDNGGASATKQMKVTMQAAMDLKLIDGWLDVDYSEGYVSELQKKLNSRFQSSEPIGNLAHYYMLDNCQTKYLAHFDLRVAAYSKPGYSWAAHALEVMQKNPKVLQVVMQTPGIDQGLEDLDASLKVWTHSGKHMAEMACNKRSINHRQFLLDVEQYNGLMANNEDCQQSRWDELVSCRACKAGKKRANLLDTGKAFHVEVDEPAGETLQFMLMKIKKGEVVNSKLAPYRAAHYDLWKKSVDLV